MRCKKVQWKEHKFLRIFTNKCHHVLLPKSDAKEDILTRWEMWKVFWISREEIKQTRLSFNISSEYISRVLKISAITTISLRLKPQKLNLSSSLIGTLPPVAVDQANRSVRVASPSMNRVRRIVVLHTLLQASHYLKNHPRRYKTKKIHKKACLVMHCSKKMEISNK